jgi:hypothetical protein
MKQTLTILAATIYALSQAGAQKQSAGVDLRYGLEKAKVNMSTFKTPDGLTASLVAAEPDVVNPTNIDVDHRGRVWAVECVNYRRYGKIRPEGDRVVILEDKDGDGAADKSKVFFQSKELTNPLGICVLPQAKGTKDHFEDDGSVGLRSSSPRIRLRAGWEILFQLGRCDDGHHVARRLSSRGPRGKQSDQQRRALPKRAGVSLRHRSRFGKGQQFRDVGSQFPQQLRGDGGFVWHALAER